jgi:hypothetical protein
LNGVVLLATQNLSDIFNSPIRDAVLESCPTKVLLPNAEAANPASRQFYESIGMNEREIDIVQKSIPKQQYYVVSSEGHRLIARGLGGVALSFVGASGTEDLQHAEQVMDQYGDRWQEEWLRSHGLLASLQQFETELRYMQARVSDLERLRVDGCDLDPFEASRQALVLVKRVGIHPHFVQSAMQRLLRAMEELIKMRKRWLVN